MNAEVEQELERIRYVHKIDEAIATGNYDSAHRELGEHQKVLEAKPPNRMIRRLWEELQHLLSLKTWAALFATLLSYKVSHDRQRGGHFATQRMRRYEGAGRRVRKGSQQAAAAAGGRRRQAGAGGRTGRDEEETTGGGGGGTDVGGLGRTTRA